MSDLAVEAEDGEVELFGHTVSDLQNNVVVENNAITGTLKYVSSGALVDRWGAGNFIALKFSDISSDATSVMVGLDPSEGSGLVELLGDPDMNGAFKITNKDTQSFKIVQSDGTNTRTQIFDLSGLTLEEESVEG